MLKTYRNIILEEANYGGLPVAYWPLDEVTGTAAADQMTLARGTGYAGTLTGGYTLGAMGPISGEASRGVTLNGSSGYIPVGEATQFQLTGDLTLEAWVRKTASTNRKTLISGYPTGVPNNYVTYLWNVNGTDNVAQFFHRNTSAETDNIVATTAINIGMWTHIAVTISGSALTHYVNGANGGTGTLAKSRTISGTRGLWMGEYYSGVGQFFDGGVAHAAVYSYALSAARIKAHYLAGINGCNGLRI